MARKLLSFAFLILIAIPLGTLPVAAEQAPPDVVRIDTGHGVFDVPYHHLIWPPAPGTVLGPRFSFAFWMPDGRPTERPAIYLPTLRPQEQGRPAPTASEYVVIATNVTSLAASNAPPPAEVQLKNILDIAGTDSFDYQRRYGLLEIAPAAGKPRPFNYYFGGKYFSDLKLAERVLLRCFRDWGPLPNHICDGTVTLDTLDLSFHFQLPEDELSQLSEAIHQTASLLIKWKEPPVVAPLQRSEKEGK